VTKDGGYIEVNDLEVISGSSERSMNELEEDAYYGSYA
jgi:hypothetical protein